MTTSLIPIKVKLLRKDDGTIDYPKGKNLPSFGANRPALKQYGQWRLDDTSHGDDDTPESPAGQRWGMRLVPKQIAVEALAQWPDRIEVLDETAVEDFWDNKAHLRMADVRYDTALLQNLHVRLQLYQAIGADTLANLLKLKIAKALDPDDDTEPGIMRNKLRKWADWKAATNVEVDTWP